MINEFGEWYTPAGIDRGCLTLVDRDKQYAKSSLDRVNTKRLIMYIRNTVTEYLDQFVEQPNDRLTRSMVASTLYSYLDTIQQRRGLERFKIICDETNNPPQCDKDMMVCDIYIQPVCIIEYAIININVATKSNTLVLDSSILSKEYHYEAYERAMSILGKI